MLKRIALPCAVASFALVTAACGSGTSTTAAGSSTAPTSTASATASLSPTSATTSATSPATTATSVNHRSLIVKDPWVKAVKGGMTGLFATLVNETDQPVRVVSAESDVAAMVQLHITEKDASGAMVMKETKDGFTVPPHGTFELRPGGNHVMLMGLEKPILSGTETVVTLQDANGGHVHIHAPAREFNGAKETYGGMSMTPNATPTAPASVSASASATTHAHR